MDTRDKVNLLLLEKQRDVLVERFQVECDRLGGFSKKSSFEKRSLKYQLEVVLSRISKLELRSMRGSKVEKAYEKELERKIAKVTECEDEITSLEAEAASIGSIGGEDALRELMEINRRIGIEKTKLGTFNRNVAIWQDKVEAKSGAKAAVDSAVYTNDTEAFRIIKEAVLLKDHKQGYGNTPVDILSTLKRENEDITQSFTFGQVGKLVQDGEWDLNEKEDKENSGA